jgi:hypothetical protein
MADTNQEQLLTELLGDVARADAHLSAPRLEALYAGVMQAAARQPPRPSGPNAMYVVIAAAAVFVVLVPAAFWMNTHVPAPAATSIVTTTEQPIAPAAAPVAPKHPQPALARRAIPPSQRAAQEPVVQSAIAHSPVAPSPDEFVPLMPMSEQELSGPFQLVRVQMPRASLKPTCSSAKMEWRAPFASPRADPSIPGGYDDPSSLSRRPDPSHCAYAGSRAGSG